MHAVLRKQFEENLRISLKVRREGDGYPNIAAKLLGSRINFDNCSCDEDPCICGSYQFDRMISHRDEYYHARQIISVISLRHYSLEDKGQLAKRCFADPARGIRRYHDTIRVWLLRGDIIPVSSAYLMAGHTSEIFHERYITFFYYSNNKPHHIVYR